MPEFWTFGVTPDGRKAWRLRVHLPDLEQTDAPAVLAWVRDYLVPAALNAPMRTTLEFVPPSDRPNLED